MSTQPVIIDAVSLRDFIEYMLAQTSTMSTLIVCGTREDFIEQLTLAGKEQQRNQAEQRPQDNEEPGEHVNHTQPLAKSSICSWTMPTLRLLSASRKLNMAFCPDITHLRAYLANYGARNSEGHLGHSPGSRILAIINPIQLHRATSAFSAQGLNRSFSVAVEAAYQTASQLVLIECPVQKSELCEVPEAQPALDEPLFPNATPRSVWDEEVSILNVTTKSFGAGERGWVGRTVKLRTIAERWFTFKPA